MTGLCPPILLSALRKTNPYRPAGSPPLGLEFRICRETFLRSQSLRACMFERRYILTPKIKSHSLQTHPRLCVPTIHCIQLLSVPGTDWTPYHECDRVSRARILRVLLGLKWLSPSAMLLRILDFKYTHVLLSTSFKFPQVPNNYRLSTVYAALSV
jgi:hypothetical protein